MFGQCSQAQSGIVGVSCAGMGVDDPCGSFQLRIFRDSVIPSELGLSSVAMLQGTREGRRLMRDIEG